MKSETIKPRTGFTLIELMIAVAVIGILAAVAYPSYQEYLRKSRRTDAKIALMQAAQSMERYYTERMTFVGAAAGTVFPTASGDGYYTLSFAAAPTASAFSILAAPVSGGPQQSDKCGTYTLNQLGAQGVGVDAILSSTACWK